MKKKCKPSIALVLTIIMLMQMSTSVFAVDEVSVELRAIPCTECTSGTMHETTEYGGWYLATYYHGCMHGFPKGHDEEHERKVYSVYACNYCSNAESPVLVNKERRITCFGKDRSVQ